MRSSAAITVDLLYYKLQQHAALFRLQTLVLCMKIDNMIGNMTA